MIPREVWLLLTTALLLLVGAVNAAAPQAGSVISNQASASFRACVDDGCAQLAEVQSVTSNLVETRVLAVPSLSLESAQLKPGASGSPVSFPHRLSNTGNGPDRYTLCVDNLAGAGIDAWRVYADTNNDGQADAGNLLFDDASADANGCWNTLTPVVDAGDSFDFVVEAVPLGSLGTEIDGLDIQVISNENPLLSDSNRDRITLVDGPVMEVSKSLSASRGLSPSGPYTVTLRYRNLSSQAATEFLLEDILPTNNQDLNGDDFPSGLIYVPGSALWSQTGNTVLTDAEDGSQSSGSEQITFCAYDASAIEPECQGRVRAVVASVPAGATGTLTFSVNVDEDIASGNGIRNKAGYRYQNESQTLQFGAGGVVPVGSPPPAVFISNTVRFTVTDRSENPAVVANNNGGDSSVGVDDSQAVGNVVQVASASQGATVAFTNTLWNSGDGTDTFDVTLDPANDRQGNPLANPFPEGTVFRLFRADGNTPLVDSSGSGVVDTGPLPVPDSSGQCPGRFVTDLVNGRCGVAVVVKAVLPPDAVGGSFQVTQWATSNIDASIVNAVTDELIVIQSSSVD
ncbi:MAG: hypothetical protein ACFE0K_03135, partial [Alcanivorax sp.]